MSYCRFSTDCDVYAYQADNQGMFVIHAASKVLPSLSDEQADLMSVDEILKFTRDNSRPIGGRFDGAVFVEPSAHKAFERIRELATFGYRVPSSTWNNFHHTHPELGLQMFATPPALAQDPGP